MPCRRSTCLVASVLILVMALTSCGEDSGGSGASGASGASCPRTPVPASEVTGTVPPPASAIEGELVFPTQDNNHVDGCVDYPIWPPVGGNHSETPRNCGFYSEAVPPEQAVHSMEHGAVWIAYGDSISEEDREVIRSATRSSTHVLASQEADLPSPVVLSSWRHQLRLDSATDPRFAEFLDAQVQGPDTPEPGASCRGVGSPEA